MPRNTTAAAAQERKAAAESNEPTPADQKMLEALLAERAGYVTRGLPKRVSQVDAQIKAYGGTPPKASPSTAEKKAAEEKAEAEAKEAAEKAEAEKAAAEAAKKA